MKLTLEALEVLDAIDRKGSFAGAAEALFKVPSAITYTIQKLEDDLGFPIFRREGRRSIMTPAGKVLLEQGQQLLQAAQGVFESAHQVHNGWESQVNIALDTLWDLNAFYPILNEFLSMDTGVQVNLTEEVMGGSLEAIIDNRVDIVVGGPPPVNQIQGVRFELIAQSEWIFVVAKNHPLLDLPQPITEADIQPYVSVVIRDSSLSAPILAHRVFEKQRTLRVASMTQKICAQIQGIGVGFLPQHKITKELANGELVPIAIHKAAPITPQFCSWRTANKGKAMRWFVEKITSGSIRTERSEPRG